MSTTAAREARIARANQRVDEASQRLSDGDYSPAATLALAEARAEQRCAYAAARNYEMFLASAGADHLFEGRGE